MSAGLELIGLSKELAQASLTIVYYFNAFFIENQGVAKQGGPQEKKGWGTPF